MDHVDKARKLKAVIDHANTPEGERDAAMNRLEYILAKNGLTIADLATEEVSGVEFTYKTKYDRDILLQVIFKVTNSREITYQTFSKRGTKLKRLRFSLTVAQRVKAELLYPIYRRAFKKEIDKLLIAFVQRHQIFSDAPASDSEGESSLTPEEVEEIMRLIDGLGDVKIPVAQLEAGGTV